MQINLFRVLLLELQRCLQSMICFCFQNISSINFNRFGSKNIMSYTTEKNQIWQNFLYILSVCTISGQGNPQKVVYSPRYFTWYTFVSVD